MRSRSWAKYVALLLMVGLMLPGGMLVAGAFGPENATLQERNLAAKERAQCQALVGRLVSALEQFVVQFAGLDGLETTGIPPLPSVPALREEAAGVRREVAEANCSLPGFRRRTAAGLGRVDVDGALAAAVRNVLTANVLDVLDGRRSPGPVEMAPGEDLATVLAGLPDGATLRLPPGDLRVDEPVIVLQDLHLVGAGRAASRIVSGAGQAALLVAAPVRLGLDRLTLTHRGDAPASLLVMRAGDAELTDVHLHGARTSAAAGGREAVEPDLSQGGSGIVLVGARSLTLSGSRVSGNDIGGLIVAGSAAATVRETRIDGNQTCGLCYLARGGGVLRDSEVTGNGVGVMAGDRAAPTLRGNRISGNREAGVVLQGKAGPSLRTNQVLANGPLGIAVYDAGSPLLDGNTVADHSEAGIVVDVRATARPRLTGNTLRGNKQAAIVFLGESRGRSGDNTCTGGRFELVLDGSADPRLSDPACAVHDQRGS